MSADPVGRRIRWYEGVTSYQWLVLVIASLGWIFDVFEGQIFVASMDEAMPALVEGGVKSPKLPLYKNLALAAFLVGGAVGGVAFGALADRIGRKRTMAYTILMYSLFTCLSAFSREWWHMVLFRFLVAMGVGGEWAVASTLVAEVFPAAARARSLAIFHASSVLGTWLAVLAGYFLVGHGDFVFELPTGTFSLSGWRMGFLVGVLPALLIVWVRLGLRESESWLASRRQVQEQSESLAGRLSELFGPALRRRTLIGVGLAAVGLATFWGTHIYGKNVLRNSVALATTTSPPSDRVLKQAEMTGMFLVTTGGGLGLIAFGPLCEAVGRRRAFAWMQAAGLATALVLFLILAPLSRGYDPLLLVFLPVFGFCTLGVHAGYAVYFPELFPTRLRGAGGGFCFNFGRLLAAPALLVSGWMQTDWKFSLNHAAAWLSGLFVVGILLAVLAPETKGKALPS